jgi:hypothetical protein
MAYTVFIQMKVLYLMIMSSTNNSILFRQKRELLILKNCFNIDDFFPGSY